MAEIILNGANGTYVFDPEIRSNCIGEGGMGRVFVGHQKETGRKVAIKVLFRELTNNQNNIERFKIESTVKIRHKNLIEMLDFVEDEGRFHVVSEFLEGEVLSVRLNQLNAKQEVFSVNDAKKIVLAVSEGLEELHKHKIIHRDIKPSNIMLLHDGNIKLFDYGVIKKSDDVTAKLTRDGSFIGSYHYSSPEQIRNIDKTIINESTDVYSLGITFYELITGKVPFDGSDYEVMDKQTKETIPLHAKLNKDCYNLIVNATAKDQKYRYKTVTQFRDDLLKLPKGPVALIRNEWWQKKNFKVSAAAATLVLIGSLAGLLIYKKNVKEHYLANVEKASNFYRIAKYDSAQIYYDIALTYMDVDSAKHSSEMLHALMPALSDYYNAKYKDAFEKFKKAATLGSGDAYYYLGELTFNGIGTVKDYKKGWEYTNKAVAQGFKMAYWRIAFAYQTGKGVVKDKDKADRYYLEAIEGMKKLAESGDPEALGNLGSMYSSGSGVPVNKKIAFDYYQKSANRGYAFMMEALGDMYKYGVGVEKNLDEAVKWYKKSADKGHPAALVSLGALYIDGDGVEKDINKGVELYVKAADQGYSTALNRLGVLCEVQDNNYENAGNYYKQAINCDNDNYFAMENLARLYSKGLGVEKNYSYAVDYYLQAVGADSSRAGNNYYSVALLYYEGGNGLAQSDRLAVKYAELADENGTTATQLLSITYNRLGVSCYKAGNYAEARKYFYAAYYKGNKTSYDNILYMNKRGE